MSCLLDLPTTHLSLCSKLSLSYESGWQREPTASDSLSLQGELARKTCLEAVGFLWLNLASRSKHVESPEFQQSRDFFLPCFRQGLPKTYNRPIHEVGINFICPQGCVEQTSQTAIEGPIDPSTSPWPLLLWAVLITGPLGLHRSAPGHSRPVFSLQSHLQGQTPEVLETANEQKCSFVFPIPVSLHKCIHVYTYAHEC